MGDKCECKWALDVKTVADELKFEFLNELFKNHTYEEMIEIFNKNK